MRILAGLGLLAAAALVAAGVAPARAASNANGNLATGGTAKGDISTTAGETDTIGVDLVAGSRVNFRWNSGFKASVGFFDPDGARIPLALDAKTSAAVNAWPVPATGRYEFRVASADGNQGLYTLQVRPFWVKTLVLDGSAATPSLDVPMPAARGIRGTVKPLPGASNPSILSFLSPEGTELLIHPIVGTAGLAKLKTVNCDTQGVYRLTAQAAAGTQTFRAVLKRSAPRVPLATVNLVNGLDQVSFATDGVASYFRHSCASCHFWAASYAGVRGFAQISVARMAAGNMPLGGPRADPATISLVRSWIADGYGK